MTHESGQSPGESVRVSMPLAFIPNVGQTDERVHYCAKGPDHAIYFTPESVVLALNGFALFLRFVGAGPQVWLEGRRQGEGRAHYFAGRDPFRWQTNLPVYGEVLYRELWPGIDAAVQGERGRLKYAFTVHPGARLEHVRLMYQGARDLSLDDYGNLVIHTPDGTMRDERQASYQVIHGEQIPVPCDFVLEQDAGGDLYVSFEAGPGYDPAYPLIVELGLTYAPHPEDGAFGRGYAIALDAAGNVYVAGATPSLNFPDVPGESRVVSGSDVFVAKVYAQGNLAYAAYLGGSGDDTATGIAVDGTSGHAYVTGSTNSADFPVTSGAYQTSLAGGFDAFVAKLHPDGSALEYSTYLGGAGLDIGHAIAVMAGSAYITGSTESDDFPATPGAFQRAKAGEGDAFVAKLNAGGTALEFATYLGGPRASGDAAVFSVGLAIDADAEGNVYVGGNTTSPHFPVTPGACQPVIGGGDGMTDGFAVKLNPAGSALVYATYLGGSGSDSISALAVGDDGSLYVTGSTTSADFPVTPGAYRTFLSGPVDAFAARLNAQGSALVYAAYLGGSGVDSGRGIRVDADGNAYVAGETASADYPVTPGAAQRVHGGGSDAFVTVLNPAGSALLYSTFLGGAEPDGAAGIALNGAGGVHLTGNIVSVEFPVAEGAVRTMSAGAEALIVSMTPELEEPSLQSEPQPPAHETIPAVALPPIQPMITEPLVLPPAARTAARWRRVRVRWRRIRIRGRRPASGKKRPAFARVAAARHAAVRPAGARRKKGRHFRIRLKKRRRQASGTAVRRLAKRDAPRPAQSVPRPSQAVPRPVPVMRRPAKAVAHAPYLVLKPVRIMSRSAPIVSRPVPVKINR